MELTTRPDGVTWLDEGTSFPSREVLENMMKPPVPEQAVFVASPKGDAIEITIVRSGTDFEKILVSRNAAARLIEALARALR